MSGGAHLDRIERMTDDQFCQARTDTCRKSDERIVLLYRRRRILYQLAIRQIYPDCHLIVCLFEAAIFGRRSDRAILMLDVCTIVDARTTFTFLRKKARAARLRARTAAAALLAPVLETPPGVAG